MLQGTCSAPAALPPHSTRAHASHRVIISTRRPPAIRPAVPGRVLLLPLRVAITAPLAGAAALHDSPSSRAVMAVVCITARCGAIPPSAAVSRSGGCSQHRVCIPASSLQLPAAGARPPLALSHCGVTTSECVTCSPTAACMHGAHHVKGRGWHLQVGGTHTTIQRSPWGSHPLTSEQAIVVPEEE